MHIIENLETFSSTNGSDLYKHRWKSSFNKEFIMTCYALLVRYDHGTDIQTGLKQVDVPDASRSSDNVSNQICLGCVCQASQNMA